MEGYTDETYGRLWAPFYDSIYEGVDERLIRLLASYAGNPARALELAVGSGRVALPLQAAGVEMTGVDISPEMIDLLRAKPGGEGVQVVQGDFAEVPVDASFPLIYLVFNTLFMLTEQERQITCFINVASHLEPGGHFIVQGFVPDLGRFDRYGSYVGVSSISQHNVHAVEMSLHDAVLQRVTSHLVRRDTDGQEVVLPVVLRYVWPAEMDLMGRIAGLDLVARWNWYDRSPFTDSSDQHVSVYRKPA